VTENKTYDAIAQWLSQTKMEDPWTGFTVGVGSMRKADQEVLTAEEPNVVEESESVQVGVGSAKSTHQS